MFKFLAAWSLKNRSPPGGIQLPKDNRQTLQNVGFGYGIDKAGVDTISTC